MATAASQDLDRMLKAMTIKDLRTQLRARGLSPAGGNEQLSERLKDNMHETKDFAFKSENGEDMATVNVTAGIASSEQAAGKSKNNYNRPGGQNTGNFMTDRCTSRVLAPPGGASQISFGDDSAAAPKAPEAASAPAAGSAPPAAAAMDNIITGGQSAGSNNNYSRPGGQNCGNFLTDRKSSRVLAPPGGASQIVFGDGSVPEKKAAPAPAPAPVAAAAPVAHVPLDEDEVLQIVDVVVSASVKGGGDGPLVGGKASTNNNYSRPGGQNVGNFLTERTSSRVLAPPGGGSQIIFG